MTVSPQRDSSRMALLYLVARELNGTLDLDQIQRRILIAAVRIAGAMNGSFFVFDQKGQIVKSLFVEGSRVTEVERAVVEDILKDGLAGWVKEHKQAALIEDVSKDPRWYDDDPELQIHQCAISVPLHSGDMLLGVLTVTHENPGYFDHNNLTMLSAVAEQATTAIRNAQLYQAEQRRRTQSNALAKIFQQMNATHQLTELFSLILEQLRQVAAYDQSAILLWRNNRFYVAAAHGIDAFIENKPAPIHLESGDFAHPVIAEFVPLTTPNLQAESTDFKTALGEKARGWMGLPLVAEGRLLGTIIVASRREDAYDRDDLQAVQMMADQAAIAIENAILMARLQTAKTRYAHLFEESSDMLLILDSDGIVLDANHKACQMLNQPKKALLGRQLTDIHPLLQESFSQHQLDLVAQSELTTELVLPGDDGGYAIIELSVKHVDIDGGTAIQWAGRDVTARRELANMRKDLTDMIVHDLRGPIGTLIGTIQMMETIMGEVEDPSVLGDMTELISIATRSGQYLKDLVDSVLDLSRMERGSLPLTISAVSMKSLFNEVSDQIMPQAAMKSIETEFSHFDEDIIINADQNMLRRVLVNLIDNAIKYTQTGGHVQISLQAEPDLLTVSISDNGTGIPSEKQTQIFEKFTRATTDISVQGVGLGLAFCKVAIEAHRGEIWLQSEEGRGSTFYFRLPRMS